MPKLKQLAFLLLFTLPFVACKKDKQTKTDCTLSEANLIGSYTYGTVKYKATPSSSAVDASSMIESCSIDDEVTFSTNHVFTYTDAGTKCDPPGDGTGSWALQGNAFTADLGNGIIQNFNCNVFTIANPDFFNTGDTLLITFKRK
jgi:hypothetical protein